MFEFSVDNASAIEQEKHEKAAQKDNKNRLEMDDSRNGSQPGESIVAQVNNSLQQVHMELLKSNYSVDWFKFEQRIRQVI